MFYTRKEWCHYKLWKHLSKQEMAQLYEETLRLVLLPQLKRLKAHGITPIWRDTAPGGTWDDMLEDINPADYDAGWSMHPTYNRIGRRVTQEAGGLILPIYDLSMARSTEHLGTYATLIGSNDFLHWCAHYSPYTVPNVWVQMLEAVVLGEAGLSTAKNQHRRLEDDSSSSDDFEEYFIRLGMANMHGHHTFSNSAYSPCPCSSAIHIFHCISNIRCKWKKNGECINAKDPQSPFPKFD